MADNDRSLLDMVKDAVMSHSSRQGGGFDSSGLISHITDLFTKHAPEHAGVRPASEDPYGDPADQEPRRRVG